MTDHVARRTAHDGVRRPDVRARLELGRDRLEIFLFRRRVGLPWQIGEPAKREWLVGQHEINRRPGLTSDRRGLSDRFLGERRTVERNEQFAKHESPDREQEQGSRRARASE